MSQARSSVAVDDSFSSPSLFYLAMEVPRVLQEMSMLLPAHPWLKNLNGGKGQPVMTLPGFGADDKSTIILRRYLNKWGYDARPWGVGQNLDPRRMRDWETTQEQLEISIAVLTESLQDIHAETGEKIALIGWSLGGIVARQLASRNPELVSRVITMGTPFGDFRSTVVYPLLKRLMGDDVEAEDLQAWHDWANAPMRGIPLTVIYSKSDGVVNPEIAVRKKARRVENIEVVSSHVGFGVHPLVFNLLAQRLQEPLKNWRAFEPSAFNKLLYRAS